MQQHPTRRRFIPVALLGMLSASFALAGETLRVEENTMLAAKPADVWKLIGSFDNLQGWHPVVAGTELTKGRNNQVGAVRTVTTKDGAKIVEALMAYDGKQRSMRYKIVASPLPVSDYQSTLSVSPSGQGSRVLWKSRFKANGVEDAKAKEIVAGIYTNGFDGLRKQLGE